LVEAFERLSPPGLKCVIVGDAPYAEEYIASLRAREREDIIFTGYVFGEGYQELLSNALVFVESSGVGGTHPALVEAMGAGNCVVVHNTPENLETIGDAGMSYDGQAGANSLVEVLEELVESPTRIADCRLKAVERVAQHYSWDRVTDDYERLFRDLLGQQGSGQ
jgi:glycosyltransferase involved in cell wall biosynthesis